jgi:PAS domain S-box-containing protein
MVPGESVVIVAGAEPAPVSLLGDDVSARVVAGLEDLLVAVREEPGVCVLAGPDLDETTATDVLRAVRDLDESLPVVVWPATVDADAATAAVRYDATEFLPGADPSVVAEHVRRALDERTGRERSEMIRTRRELETARERFSYLFEHIPDAVVETEYVDGEPVVRNVNAAFQDVFGYDPDEVIGSSLEEYVLTEEQSAGGSEIHHRTMAGEEVVDQVRGRTADGVREFLLRSVPYRSNTDTVRGFAIYTDVTERTERERRLSVLTNVLRHNLRTDMNIVLGQADAILELDPDPEVVERVEALRRSAEAVVDMGETAGDIESLVEWNWGTERSVDLVDLVDDVVWRVDREHPEATFEVELPETAPVRGDEAIERAVHELVENAVVHQDGEPTVTVSVERTGEERVELRVVDDGPGVPTFERELVAGEREVNQLDHGSGLGLWIAHWTAESLDGSLALLDAEDGGTVARLRLQAA